MGGAVKRIVFIGTPLLVGILAPLIFIAESGGSDPVVQPPQVLSSPSSGGRDTGVVLAPPTDSPAISGDDAVRLAEQLMPAAATKASSIAATLVTFSDEDPGGGSLLAWDVKIEGVCVPNLGGQGGPACASSTWHVVIDATTGSAIESYSSS
jgi:hypothetical protein